MKADYSTWITKPDAAAAIGVSTKQIERWAQDGMLQTAKYKRPDGGTPIRVYHPAEVEKLAKERNPDTEPFVVPPEKPAGNGAGAVRQPLSADRFLQLLASAMATSQTSETRLIDAPSETSQTCLPLWLTVDQAAAYSGLPASALRFLIDKGELKARYVGVRRGGQWRICKAALEELR